MSAPGIPTQIQFKSVHSHRDNVVHSTQNMKSVGIRSETSTLLVRRFGAGLPMPRLQGSTTRDFTSDTSSQAASSVDASSTASSFSRRTAYRPAIPLRVGVLMAPPAYVPAHYMHLWDTLQRLESDARQLVTAEPQLYARYAALFANVCAAVHVPRDSSSQFQVCAMPLELVVRVWKSFIIYGTPFAADYVRMAAVLVAFGHGRSMDALCDASALAEFRFEHPQLPLRFLHLLRVEQRRELLHNAAESNERFEPERCDDVDRLSEDPLARVHYFTSDMSRAVASEEASGSRTDRLSRRQKREQEALIAEAQYMAAAAIEEPKLSDMIPPVGQPRENKKKPESKKYTQPRGTVATWALNDMPYRYRDFFHSTSIAYWLNQRIPNHITAQNKAIGDYSAQGKSADPFASMLRSGVDASKVHLGPSAAAFEVEMPEAERIVGHAWDVLKTELDSTDAVKGISEEKETNKGAPPPFTLQLRVTMESLAGAPVAIQADSIFRLLQRPRLLVSSVVARIFTLALLQQSVTQHLRNGRARTAIAVVGDLAERLKVPLVSPRLLTALQQWSGRKGSLNELLESSAQTTQTNDSKDMIRDILINAESGSTLDPQLSSALPDAPNPTELLVIDTNAQLSLHSYLLRALSRMFDDLNRSEQDAYSSIERLAFLDETCKTPESRVQVGVDWLDSIGRRMMQEQVLFLPLPADLSWPLVKVDSKASHSHPAHSSDPIAGAFELDVELATMPAGMPASLSRAMTLLDSRREADKDEPVATSTTVSTSERALLMQRTAAVAIEFGAIRAGIENMRQSVLKSAQLLLDALQGIDVYHEVQSSNDPFVSGAALRNQLVELVNTQPNSAAATFVVPRLLRSFAGLGALTAVVSKPPFAALQVLYPSLLAAPAATWWLKLRQGVTAAAQAEVDEQEKVRVAQKAAETDSENMSRRRTSDTKIKASSKITATKTAAKAQSVVKSTVAPISDDSQTATEFAKSIVEFSFGPDSSAGNWLWISTKKTGFEYTLVPKAFLPAVRACIPDSGKRLVRILENPEDHVRIEVFDRQLIKTIEQSMMDTAAANSQLLSINLSNAVSYVLAARNSETKSVLSEWQRFESGDSWVYVATVAVSVLDSATGISESIAQLNHSSAARVALFRPPTSAANDTRAFLCVRGGAADERNKIFHQIAHWLTTKGSKSSTKAAVKPKPKDKPAEITSLSLQTVDIQSSIAPFTNSLFGETSPSWLWFRRKTSGAFTTFPASYRPAVEEAIISLNSSLSPPPKFSLHAQTDANFVLSMVGPLTQCQVCREAIEAAVSNVAPSKIDVASSLALLASRDDFILNRVWTDDSSVHLTITSAATWATKAEKLHKALSVIPADGSTVTAFVSSTNVLLVVHDTASKQTRSAISSAILDLSRHSTKPAKSATVKGVVLQASAKKKKQSASKQL